jgi:hypothetical protein
MSPVLIAKYQTCLPDKEILQNKLRELREMAEVESVTDDEREGDEEWKAVGVENRFKQ